MPDRPNIVFIFPDQLRHDMLGCYGHPAAITPNIDALAAAGTRFTNCYSSNPLCLPARSSIITGKYCNQHHCHSNREVLHEDELCWPARLRDSGYYTSLVGKLHLWEQYGKGGFTSVDHGFQYKQMVEGKASIGNGVEESGWYFDYLRDKGLPFPHQWVQDSECKRMGHARISEYEETDYIDGVIGTRAVRQILEGRRLSVKRDKPFCMQVGICSPHDPYDPPQKYFDMYEGVNIPDPVFDPVDNSAKASAFKKCVEKCSERMGFSPDEGYNEEVIARIRFMRRCYLATVTFIDEQVGRIMQALEDAGIADNTVVVFCSDHGEFTGNRGVVQKAPFLYEDNVHVPLIIHAPFMQKEPSVAEGLVQNLDICATVLEFAGMEPRQNTMSRSLVPMLKDPATSVRDAAFAEYFDRKMIRQGRYKMIVEKDYSGTELYDLEADPGERNNLARDPSDPDQTTSDPRYSGIMNELFHRMVQWQDACEWKLRPEES